jgi:hypothetical protein
MEAKVGTRDDLMKNKCIHNNVATRILELTIANNTTTKTGPRTERIINK